MSFYKQPNSYSREKKEVRHLTPAEAEILYEKFLIDWEKLRVRNACQQVILDYIFIDGKKYGFARIGRKGSKTTTNIDVSWKFSMKKPRSTTFICLPTITQAIEVYWDEKRIQWCDQDNPYMADTYIRSIDNNKHMLTFINGSIIKLIGTWSEARGRGTQPDLLIVDEIQDASANYLDGMEPNLAAKADSVCLMTGTPPKKKNHYHEWEDRIILNTEGFNVKYTSYANTALPHLKGWLDNKKLELIAAGKEDVWLREYMAEDCFRSDDRVLPDVDLMEFDELLYKLRSVDSSIYRPIFGLIVAEHAITAVYGVMFHTRFTGSEFFLLESKHINRIWDRSYTDIYSEMTKKMDEFSSIFKKSWRKVVYDETSTFCDVISGFSNSRTDLKWSMRGIPLLKELIINKKLTVSTKAEDFGIGARNLLKEDPLTDYPIVCAMAMLANEFYQSKSMSPYEQKHWDKMAPLREAGIVVAMPKKNKLLEKRSIK